MVSARHLLGGFACCAHFRAFANCAQSWLGAFCRPPYLLSQCKYRSLAPPLSCCELHSAFSSTRLASFRSCASFFLLRAAHWTFPCSSDRHPCASQCGGLSSCCWRANMSCLAPDGLRVSACFQLPVPTSPVVVVTSMNRGRFLLSESPASDVSGLDVQCPPFTVQLQQLVLYRQ